MCRTDLGNGEIGKEDRNGSQYWIYRDVSDNAKYVFDKLFQHFTLEDHHKQHLTNDRGFTYEEIEKLGYRSINTGSQMNRFMEAHEKFLYSVPGFYTNNGSWRCKQVKGIAIPIRNQNNEIVGVKVRNEGKGSKYVNLSSGKLQKGQENGTKAHTALHCPCVGKAASTIRVTEGEFKADFATLRSDTYTVSIPGVSTWRLVLDYLSQNKHIKAVRIAMDSDWKDNAQVLKPMMALHKELTTLKYQVFIETWNPRYKGIDDALNAGEDIITCDEAQVKEFYDLADRAHSGSNGTVVFSQGDIVNDKAEKVLNAFRSSENSNGILIYGNSLVAANASGIADIDSVAACRGYFQRAIRCNMMTEDGPRVIDMPRDLCEHILMLQVGEMNKYFSELQVITRVPVLSKSGKIHNSRGYDVETGVLMTTDYSIDGVPDKPTQQDIDDARNFLLDMVCDFPFVDQSDIAHFMSFMIQPFIRPIINGPTPLYMIDKPKQGTGATLLCKIVGVIKTGQDLGLSTWPKSEDEVQKTILSKLKESPDFIAFDNCTSIYSDSFASLLTSTVYSQRALGTNKDIKVPVNATIVINGNNVSFGKDYTRRICNIRLDANVEDPSKRNNFKHGEITNYVKQNRRQIIRCILTLIQAWVEADMPESSDTKASYEEWSRKMGGLLNVAGIKGFNQTPKDRTTVSDSDEDEIMELMAHWLCLRKLTGDKFEMMSGSQIFELMRQNQTNFFNSLSRDKPIQALNAKLRKGVDQVRNFIFSDGSSVAVKLIESGSVTWARKFTLKFIHGDMSMVEAEKILPGKVIEYDLI